MSYNEVKPSDGTSYPPIRSQSSHLEWDDTKFKFLNKCSVKCDPHYGSWYDDWNWLNQKDDHEGNTHTCEANHCDNL
jgi:hypothetical protein